MGGFHYFENSMEQVTLDCRRGISTQNSMWELSSQMAFKVGPKPSSVGYPVQIPVPGFCGTEILCTTGA